MMRFAARCGNAARLAYPAPTLSCLKTSAAGCSSPVPPTALQDQCNGGGHLLPVRHFPFELLAASFREGVEPGEAIERGVERTLLDLQDVARGLLDALGNAPAVHGLERECFENQKSEGALQDFDGRAHGLSPRRATGEMLSRTCRLLRGEGPDWNRRGGTAMTATARGAGLRPALLQIGRLAINEVSRQALRGCGGAFII